MGYVLGAVSAGVIGFVTAIGDIAFVRYGLGKNPIGFDGLALTLSLFMFPIEPHDDPSGERRCVRQRPASLVPVERDRRPNHENEHRQVVCTSAW